MDETLIAGGFALVVGAISLFIAGPLGMLAMGLVLILAGIAGSGSPEAQEEIEERINCSECGAVNARSDETCHYCEASIGA